MSDLGYSPGHPWYYRLGGRTLGPKAILRNVMANGYEGYAAHDITEADALSEPKRSDRLRALRAQYQTRLVEDLARYRELVRTLRRMRRDGCDMTEISTSTTCVFTALSLKHNHINNDLAHLHRLDALLSVQGDLFG